MASHREYRPAGRRVYVEGSRQDLRVPVREIDLTGSEPAVRLYDTSGQHGDPERPVDLERGIAPLRGPWIVGRDDVEQLETALVNLGYDAGHFGYLTLLTAQRTYFGVSLEYLESLKEFWAQSVELEGMLLSGGLERPE
jgi:hypothetical protein